MVEEATKSWTASIMTIATISSGSSDNPRTLPAISSPPIWKLYDNPHYSVLSRLHNSKSRSSPSTCSNSKPRSVFSASRGFMETHRHVNLPNLDKALAKIKELRSQLDSEHRMRRKVEATSKTPTREKEVAEEKCRKLTKEMSCTIREEGQKENPHIKRGIKGMEFPRAVLRSRGGGGRGSNGVTGYWPSSREGRSGSGVGSSMSSNLECQRAQLRVLMRHKSNTSPTYVFHNNLVM